MSENETVDYDAPRESMNENKQEEEIKQQLPLCETRFLHITNLSRPFTVPQLKEYLSAFGLEDEKCAKNILENVHGKLWPLNTGKVLSVEFVQEEACKQYFCEQKEALEAQGAVKKVVTLDELFCKTKSKPHIYYLPVVRKEAEKEKQ